MSHIVFGVDRVRDTDPLVNPTVLAGEVIKFFDDADKVIRLFVGQAGIYLSCRHVRPSNSRAMALIGALNQRLHPQHAAAAVSNHTFTARLQRIGHGICSHGAGGGIAGHKPNTHAPSPIAWA
ncbi:MAG: Uncharacterised protein [Halieaceae bacterium]|nr:MAG: Uncharacterised protein [Halieaceae bacterium]